MLVDNDEVVVAATGHKELVIAKADVMNSAERWVCDFVLEPPVGIVDVERLAVGDRNSVICEAHTANATQAATGVLVIFEEGALIEVDVLAHLSLIDVKVEQSTRALIGLGLPFDIGNEDFRH